MLSFLFLFHLMVICNNSILHITIICLFIAGIGNVSLNSSNIMGDVHFWRQILILVTLLFSTMSVGLMLTFPSALSPALQSSNDTDDIRATSDQISWIVASNGIAGIFGFFISSPLLQKYGRKMANICNNIFVLVGWIIFPLARSTTELFIARIIQGFCFGGIFINVMIVAEYSDPKRRGYFMILKTAAIAVGTLLFHILSLFWNWRQIATFSIMLSVVGIVLTLFWPESPSYLAMKGHIKDWEESFIWLRGTTNMKELEELINTQTYRQQNSSKDNWYTFLFKVNFVKPLLIVSLLSLLLDLCGKFYFVVYAIEIMVELVGDKSSAIYCTIGADLLIIVALMTSCIVIGCFKRRSILFTLGWSTVALMLLISLVIVLKISGTKWLTPALILLLCFLVNVGLIPVIYTLIGEMFPLEYKGSGSFVSGVVFTLFYTVILKLTPILIDCAGVEGVYATYGISIAICLVVLFFIVPETKDRSLQEIENEFKPIKISNCNENIHIPS